MEYLNNFLKPIRESVGPSIKFIDSVSKISKNPGITLLIALDASEGDLQLFHHPTVLGGNWIAKSQKVVAVLGFNDDASPVQIIENSIKEKNQRLF